MQGIDPADIYSIIPNIDLFPSHIRLQSSMGHISIYVCKLMAIELTT